MKGRAIPYSAAELAWLEARADWPRRKLHAAFCEHFGRGELSFDNLKALCSRKAWRTGRTGQFEPGIAAHNKGKKCEPGKGGLHPNARRTQFKRGGLPHNTKWLGHERVSKDGYVEISVAEPNPHTGFHRRYVLKHRHLWEQEHGPVPAGHCLKCRDGNKLNTDPSNWEAIPRSLLPSLNGRWNGLAIDRVSPELKPAIMAMAKIKARRRALKDGKR